MGFNKQIYNDRKVWSKFSFSIDVAFTEGEYYYHWIGGNTRIKHVHNIQNLFFCLHGYELELSNAVKKSYKQKLVKYHNQIEESAKIIYQTFYNHKPEPMWKGAVDFENGLIGNIDIYLSVKAAISVFGQRTESDMHDMVDEFEEIGLPVISVF